VPKGDFRGELALAAPWPNPAAGPALIEFALPREGRVSLAVFDLSGRRVRTLLEGPAAAGEQTRTWDLRDDTGHASPSGLYFIRLEADGRVLTKRLATIW
jgi:hypothetical protein